MSSLNPDVIVDRRRIKRRLSMWRFFAVIALVMAVVAFYHVFSDEGLPLGGKHHIAVIDIDGLITGKRSRIDLLRKIKASKSIKALIVRIDSPGGTTTGSEVIYEEIREIAAEKPVVAVLNNIAASGGYLVALAADHVIARGNTITGSIGGYIRWARVDDALGKLGIEVNQIKSAPLKAEPSLFGRMSDQAHAVTERMVKDSHEWFVSLVADRRPFNLAKAKMLADGRVYTGRQAIKENLVDELGGEREARAWLSKKKGLDKNFKVIEWELEATSNIPFSSNISSWIGSMIGISLGRSFAIGSIASTEPLDGLLSLWHPELSR
jgi:protease-4